MGGGRSSLSQQPAPALEEWRPRVRGFDVVRDPMSEGRGRRPPAGGGWSLRVPVAETGSEAVRHGCDALLLE